MRKTLSIWVLGAAAASLASVASAAPIINDNFDGYANQAALDAVWLPIGASGGVQLSTAQASSAPQSVYSPATPAIHRSRGLFAETQLAVGSPIAYSFDFYDVDTATFQRQYCNLQDSTAPGSSNQLISMGINNNQTASANGGNLYMARILGYTSEDTGATSGSYFKLNDFPGAERSVGWHNLKVIISTDDGVGTDYAFYVNNVLVETVDNVGTVVRSYDNITLGSGVTATAGAYFDNMYLEVVPEPASLSVLGLAALVLKRRR